VEGLDSRKSKVDRCNNVTIAVTRAKESIRLKLKRSERLRGLGGNGVLYKETVLTLPVSLTLKQRNRSELILPLGCLTLAIKRRMGPNQRREDHKYYCLGTAVPVSLFSLGTKAIVK
jgi:hypothetical protein